VTDEQTDFHNLEQLLLRLRIAAARYRAWMIILGRPLAEEMGYQPDDAWWVDREGNRYDAQGRAWVEGERGEEASREHAG